MEVDNPKKRSRRTTKYVPKQYANAAIPYGVSKPNAYWRIKKDLAPDQYWKKRYWRRRITGRGAYTMNKKEGFGKRWGGYLGSRLGEMAGGGLHSLVSKITGLGDYSVRKNVFMDGQIPQVTNPTSGGVVIRHCEFLGDVTTSAVAGTFTISSFLINAANSLTFPWLSQIAANFEQYELEGCLFDFRSTSSDALNSTNTALGSVIMATQYDTLDNIFASKSEMLNYEYSTSCKPSTSNMHMIECDPHQTAEHLFYTLPLVAPPTTGDPRLYHLGRFNIATVGFQGSSVNIGELHVTYQVRLLKPKLYTSLGFLDVSTQFIGAGPTPAFAFGDPGLTLQSNNFLASGFLLDQTARTITWPRTNAVLFWRVEITWGGGVAAAPNFIVPTTTWTNGSQLNGIDFQKQYPWTS